MELNELLFNKSELTERDRARKVENYSRQRVSYANFLESKEGDFSCLATTVLGACHSGFLRTYVSNVLPSHGLTLVDHTTVKLDPHHNLYFDWLLNESPFSLNFLTKNSDSAKEYGIVIKQNEECRGHPFASVIATRMLQEHTYNGELWVELVLAGVDKNLAYVIATSWQGEGEKKFLDAINHGGCTFYCCNKEDVKRFLTNNPHKDVGRSAEVLFANNRSESVFLDKWRPAFSNSTASRWGHTFRSIPQKALVEYYAENWQAMLEDLGLPFDGEPVVKKKKPKAVVINTDEPETDL